MLHEDWSYVATSQGTTKSQERGLEEIFPQCFQREHGLWIPRAKCVQFLDCKKWLIAKPSSVEGGGMDVGFVHSSNQLFLIEYCLCKLLASFFRIENVSWKESCGQDAASYYLFPRLGIQSWESKGWGQDKPVSVPSCPSSSPHFLFPSGSSFISTTLTLDLGKRSPWPRTSF